MMVILMRLDAILLFVPAGSMRVPPGGASSLKCAAERMIIAVMWFSEMSAQLW